MGFMQNVGSNFLGTSVAAVVLVSVGASFGWRNAFFIAAVPAFISALSIWWLVREPHKVKAAAGIPAERLTLGQAFAQRNIVLCVLISILLVSYLVVCFVLMPLFLTQVRAYEPDVWLWLIATLGVSAALADFIVPGISDWVGRKPLMLLTPLFGIILPLGALYFEGSWWALAGIFFLGWTVIGTFPLFMATIPSETVDPRHTATALGLIMGIGEGVGGAPAPAIAGGAANRYGLEASLWIMVALTLCAAAPALGLRETAPRPLARGGKPHQETDQ